MEREEQVASDLGRLLCLSVERLDPALTKAIQTLARDTLYRFDAEDRLGMKLDDKTILTLWERETPATRLNFFKTAREQVIERMQASVADEILTRIRTFAEDDLNWL